MRQVHFSPSVGRDSDYAYQSNHNDNSNNYKSLRRRDGRYRSIHPVQATVQALSTVVAPIHKKTRLPMRPDVGFPSATQDEVQRKQEEIRQETAWEEASLRLVVLVMSDDLGSAVSSESSSSSAEGSKNGLEGIPYAGKELQWAAQQNMHHFGGKDIAATTPHFSRPDPYSMLAPPLDASFSASQGWRPRPFQDRPAGMVYLLVSPLQVVTEHDELLLGSLALYALPHNNNNNNKSGGKISEDFWFPAAGNWAGQVRTEGTRRTGDGSTDPELVDLWLQRKKKAIFSCDRTQRQQSLYVVLKVYKMIRVLNKEADNDSSTLLSPVCFGIADTHAPFKEEDDGHLQWPRGRTQEMTLHACEGTWESQEEFVERLVGIVQSGAGDPLLDSSDHSQSSGEGTKKRSFRGRVFRSPMKPSKSRDPLSNGPSAATGRCNLFVSSLSVDFLQCMLTNPPELQHGLVGSKRRLPRLFVDVSGDFAVALEEDRSEQREPLNTETVRKRSSLLRLPAAPNPGGYAGSFEFREVLRLPARPEKHYFFDSPLSNRSTENLLFLYPHLLRQIGDEKLGNVTVRIRVVHTEKVKDERTGETKTISVPLMAFHNPASWSTGESFDRSLHFRNGFLPSRRRIRFAEVYYPHE